MTVVMRCYFDGMRGVIGRFLRGRPSGESHAFGSLRRHTLGGLLAPLVLIGVLLAGGVIQASSGVVVTVLLLLGLAALLGLHGWRMYGALKDPSAGLPARQLAADTALTVVFGCLAVAQNPGNTFVAVLVGFSGATALLGRSARLGWGIVAALAVGTGAAFGGVAALSVDEPGVILGVMAVSAGMVVLFAGAEYMCIRQWELSFELERARREAGELATTRERLRVAEDLHDVLGHALEVVAFKSELATRLSEQDGERARAEMAEVQQLARGALHDVRELVQAERATDLTAEFTSVRSLLSSAGIDCECAGEPNVLAAGDSALFGRVLREAATNLLRHANPRHCSVSLTLDADSATLLVRNDGSTLDYQPPEGEGSGLAGLARRVESAGGTFHAGPTAEPSTFEVSACLPVAAVR